MVLTASQEDYLESLFVITRSQKVARVKDVAEALKISMPSVSAALKNLEKKGLLKHDHYGYIELTPEGEDIGEKIYETHLLLSDFLTRILKVSPKTAEHDACLLEHNLSSETRKCLIEFIGRLKKDKHFENLWNKKIKK